MNPNNLLLSVHLFVLMSKLVTLKGIARFGGRGGLNSRKEISVFQPFGPSDRKNYYTSYDIHGSSYGTSFGPKTLESDTHIYNNNFKFYDSRSRYKVYRAEDLFKRDNHYNSKLPAWSDREDRQWRLTTRAPYFENRIPQSPKVLSATVVIGFLILCHQKMISVSQFVLGAASAFGLTTLLPLNIPKRQPLIYCPNQELEQARIKLDGKFYSCIDAYIQIECSNDEPISTTAGENDSGEGCVDRKVSTGAEDIDEALIYMDGVLMSTLPIVCDSITGNEDSTTIDCYYGELPLQMTSFIPTTENPVTTTERAVESIPWYKKVQKFFCNLFRLNDKSSSEIPETSDKKSDDLFDSDAWYPDALTLRM